MLVVKIYEQVCEVLYDTRLQFTIIKYSTDDDLTKKPPLYKVSQCGVGIDGLKFKFNGLVYVNFGLITENRETFSVEYGPVFVPLQISTNISEIKINKCFKSCFKNHKNLKLFTVQTQQTFVLVKTCRRRLQHNIFLSSKTSSRRVCKTS